MHHTAAIRIQRAYRLFRASAKLLQADTRPQDELIPSAQPEVHVEGDDSQESNDDQWYEDNPREFCGYRCGQQCWDCQRRADYYSREPGFDLADEF